MTRPELTLMNEFTWAPTTWHDLAYPNEFTWVSGHDQNEVQVRGKKMNHTNMHKAHPGSQLGIFYMGMRVEAHPHTKQIDQMSLHGCPQMTHPNEFAGPPSNNLLERVYMTTLKRPA